MKYFYFFTLLFLSDWAVAQNYIYKKDGIKVYGQVVDIDDDKVKYITGDDPLRNPRSKLKLSDIVLIFNKYGDFLCFTKGASMQEQTEESNFIHEGPSTRNNDIIFDNSGKITAARYIDDEGDSVIIAKGGKEIHLSKSSLIAIIKKDGTHNLYVGPSNAVLYLSNYVTDDKKALIAQMLTQPEEPPVVKIAKVESKPELQQAPAQPGATASTNTVLPPPDMAFFEAKGKDKIKSFEGDIKNIIDPATAIPQSDKSIDLACELFLQKSHIQVSSLNSKTKTVSVEFYLKSLQQNSSHYSSVLVNFAEINYASNFSPNPDGTYSAQVTIVQDYQATADGNVVYKDETTKTIIVTIKKVKKIEANGIAESWDVFLGDVSVRETANN